VKNTGLFTQLCQKLKIVDKNWFWSNYYDKLIKFSPSEEAAYSSAGKQLSKEYSVRANIKALIVPIISFDDWHWFFGGLCWFNMCVRPCLKKSIPA